MCVLLINFTENVKLLCLFIAAIGVVKVLVNVPPFGDDIIPVEFHLVDDDKIEPMDIYQLTIVNFSDPRAVVGDEDTTYIIVNDDDGKIRIPQGAIYYIHTCNITMSNYK